ncbi:hypothetical protein THAOC_21552 [Thalassiosira oceanica]|uniref:Uncharacterized protein n=1 Tax=Thalassiosira oceanica TaxID=159749 RepID=K0RZ57_THAOC|nr:hypothetical protein THAOC_21552 [Thalassiosira oceanica]|eukprot:EJK58335.1 hypothetical protein THAOC_21552 [Thalassiosira oceanica]
MRYPPRLRLNPGRSGRSLQGSATTFQFATSHISKVTDHIIKNVAIYNEWSVRLDKANSVCNFLHVRKLHELVEGLIKAFEEYSTDDGVKLIEDEEPGRFPALAVDCCYA